MTKQIYNQELGLYARLEGQNVHMEDPHNWIYIMDMVEELSKPLKYHDQELNDIYMEYVLDKYGWEVI